MVMLVYSIIVYIVAIGILLLGIFIYRGKTNLIYSYHQTKVKDKAGYGRAMGRITIVLSIILLICATIPFFWKEEAGLVTAILIQTGAILLTLIAIYLIQKKYNNGMF